MSKPNCYECRHRDGVAGSAHSSCQHPEANAARADNPLNEAMAILASVGRVAPVVAAPKKITVVGHPHGIRRGWFNWPYNFDPAWLKECSGFEVRAKKETAGRRGATP